MDVLNKAFCFIFLSACIIIPMNKPLLTPTPSRIRKIRNDDIVFHGKRHVHLRTAHFYTETRGGR